DVPASVFTTDLDGTIRLSGEGLSVTFTATGVTLWNFDATPAQSVTYALQRVLAGSTTLFDITTIGAVRPEFAISGVIYFERYTRTSTIQDRYRTHVGGVEQIFRITDPLPTGTALRVLGAVSTTCTIERELESGIVFRSAPTDESPDGECVGVYGDPAIIDA